RDRDARELPGRSQPRLDRSATARVQVMTDAALEAPLGLGVLRRLSHLPPSVAASLAALILLIAAGLLAPVLATHDGGEQDLLARLETPLGAGHWFGTDHLGRDLYSRLLFGLRTTLLIAAAGVVVGAVIGTAAGIVSAMAGGIVDEALMLIS